MSLSYEPLWNLLNSLNISKMDLANRIDISNATLAKLGKNEPVTLTVIEKICNEFNCNINNVVTHIIEEKEYISTDLLQIGTIITCPCVPISVRIRLRNEEIRTHNAAIRQCVILKKINDSSDNYRFLTAPISYNTEPESIFDIMYDKFIIDHKQTKGYIQISQLSTIRYQYIYNICGSIPTSYIDNNINTIITQLAPILINNNLIPKALLHNYGFVYN